MADLRRFDLLPGVGALRGENAAAERELGHALSDLRTALTGAQDLGSILGGAHADLSTGPAGRLPVGLVRAAPFAEGAVAPTGRNLVNIRAAPLADVDPFAPAWARSMRPTVSRGPFLNEFGERFWIDTFALPKLVSVFAQTGPFAVPRFLASLPLRRSPATPGRLRLGAGSVWLTARLLVQGRPMSEFVGLRIRGGSVQLDGITASTSTSVTLEGAWKITLQLQLDAPPNPSPSNGPGVDATHATVNLPATVTLAFDASGAVTVSLANATATAYGTSFGLARTADPPFYDSLSRSVVVPCSATPSTFAFATVQSASWTIGSEVPIARSGWALPVAVTTPQALGEAAGAGLLWLELGAPVQASWTGLPHKALLPKSELILAPGTITIVATVSATDVTQRLRLWDEPESEPLRQSSIDVLSVSGSTVLYVSQPGTEAVLLAGKATGHFDRPVAADGGRVAVRMPAAWLLLVELAAGTTVAVLGADPGAHAAPHLAFALENALAKVRPPAWLYAAGPLTGDQLTQGLMLLRFPYRTLLPTLPDPYAANFGLDRRQDVDIGWMTAAVAWATPPAATLAFSIQTDQGVTLPVGPGFDQPAAGFTNVQGGRLGAVRVLLDVSSNADQFGVVIPFRAASVSVQGMAVVAQASEVGVITLPPISWEPMLTKTPQPSSGDPPLPPPPHDGGPALLTADTKDVRPVEPIPLLATYHDAINAHRHFTARLPLPFGLIAQVQTLREQNAGSESKLIPGGGKVFLNRPDFTVGVTGGLQLAIAGRPNANPQLRDPTLPGYVELRNENSYAKGVLSENIHTRFDGDFGFASPNGVPVRRYDLSGYGASLLSDWRDPEAVGPAIIEARFDVLVGRTSHEVIQMQSVLHPWFVRVVRTITIDRTPGGWILREDSGWVPTTDGRFKYVGDPKGVPAVPEAFPDARRHPGVVEALINVRNIQLDGAQFDVPARQASDPPTTWQAVTFDAEVLFVNSANPRLVIAGGSANRTTPTRGATGWIQIGGATYNTKADDGQIIQRTRPADGQQVFDLLLLKGPARALIDCTLGLGGTAADPGMVFRAIRIDATCNTDGNTPHLVAALRGSPTLPRDGAWSLARIAQSDTAPNALDPAFPVPVVGPHSGQPGFGRWHLADPGDITQLGDAATPAMRYGLVQSLGTQKVFFARPRVGNDADPITLPQTPQLADMGALLNAAGIFPGLGDAFNFQTLKSLSVSAGDLGFSETFPIGTQAAPKEATLVDLGGANAIQVVIEYHDENGQPTVASITVDPAASPRWRLALTRACFAVRFKGKPLISIFATVKAEERTAPTVVDLRVRYESILNVLQTIFSNIQQVARFLPGGAGAGLHVGFSQGRLTVHNAFALPKLPLGAGQITDVDVDMGFDVALAPFDVQFAAGLGSSQKPFRWVVSPLAGTGVVRVGISPKGLDVLVQAGLGLGLAIDLGIAAGSASITLAVELNTGPDPFEIRGILSGRASVDVLAGLASATITLAAGLGIIPPPQLFAPPFVPPQLLPPPDKIPSLTVGLTASVTAGIHISICWVVDVDWDGYWQFRQDITTPEIPIPA